jgi:anion-transporting  ArsA/GET3 family ATPase
MTGKLPFNLDIPKRGASCAKGGEAFHPGTEYHSILLETNQDQYKRQDFCCACWDNFAKEEMLAQATSHWKAHVIVSAKQNDKGIIAKQDQIQDDQVLDILKNGLDSEKIEDHAESFLLALYLARKKILILREQFEKENQTIFLYEIASTEEILPIRKVALSELQTAAIQQRLASKLRKKNQNSG